MTSKDIQVAAFRDELSKIAGEMQGATRAGRKPISVDKYLEREGETVELPDFVLEAGEVAAKAVVKMAGVGRVGLHLSNKTIAALGLGGVGALTLRQANEDRRLGRAVRRQQGQ
jgi:hypothetical protein